MQENMHDAQDLSLYNISKKRQTYLTKFVEEGYNLISS